MSSKIAAARKKDDDAEDSVEVQIVPTRIQ